MQISHIWSDWCFEADDSCAQERVCQRCNEKETQVIHTWIELYTAPDSCVKMCACSRCGEKKTDVRIALANVNPTHDWGEWHFREEGDCTQERVCQRCNKKETQVVHTWAELYTAPDSCVKMCACSRCGEKKTDVRIALANMRPAHSWSEWHFRDDGDCTQQRECQHCGLQETKIVHDWEHAYIGPVSCQQVIACKRCNEKKPGIGATLTTLLPAHTWSAWQYTTESSCNQVRVCQRCGERENKIVHQWSDWSYRTAHNCTQTRTCDRCHKIEHQTVHDWSDNQGVSDYTIHNIALSQIMRMLDQKRDVYQEALLLENRLQANITDAKIHGETETLIHERNRILEEIDRLAQEAVKHSFYEMEELLNYQKDISGRLRVIDRASGLPVRFCTRCGETKAIPVSV